MPYLSQWCIQRWGVSKCLQFFYFYSFILRYIFPSVSCFFPLNPNFTHRPSKCPSQGQELVGWEWVSLYIVDWPLFTYILSSLHIKSLGSTDRICVQWAVWMPCAHYQKITFSGPTDPIALMSQSGLLVSTRDYTDHAISQHFPYPFPKKSGEAVPCHLPPPQLTLLCPSSYLSSCHKQHKWISCQKFFVQYHPSLWNFSSLTVLLPFLC